MDEPQKADAAQAASLPGDADRAATPDLRAGEAESGCAWTCPACGTRVDDGAETCPLCGGTQQENERLRQAAEAKRQDTGGEAKRWADMELPWFTGFLLLFPPALIVYLLWKLISQAGALPLDEEDQADGQPAPSDPTPRNT